MMGFPNPYTNVDLDRRVLQLERALTMSLDLLCTLVDKLDSKFGPGFLGEELQRLTGTSEMHAREDIGRVEELLKQDQQPKAARLFRELTGVTWDQAHDIIGRWSQYSLQEKTRWLQIGRWVKSFDAATAASPSQEK
jgi:hypothetical protein